MAHVLKVSRGNATRIIGHCMREKSESGDYLKYKTNSKINPDRTFQNYKLAFDEKNSHERLNAILETTYCFNRKDVNVMADWVVTLPKNYDGDPREFFKETTKFLFERYGGAESFVGAFVHMDETTPHLHYLFVPRVWDVKKERFKVCAKEVLTKTDLSLFHKDLGRHLETSLGMDPALVNSGVTKRQGGNKNAEELEAYNQEIRAKEKRLGELTEEAQKKQDRFDGLTKEKAELSSQKAELSSQKAELTSEVAKLSSEKEEMTSEVNRLRTENRLLKEEIKALAFLKGVLQKIKELTGFEDREAAEEYLNEILEAEHEVSKVEKRRNGR